MELTMDIFNHRPRPIVCCTNSHNEFGTTNANTKLTIGEIYHVTNINVGGCFTLIELEEFPGIRFNSVLFEEVSGRVTYD